MKIGYQGTPYSYNHSAAKLFKKKKELKSTSFVPLHNSQRVVDALLAGDIDYGVMAVKNTIAGVVTESFEALKTESFELVDTIILPIQHCLFISPQARLTDINEVASHEMAIKQCGVYLKKTFVRHSTINVSDTSKAAEMLANKTLDQNVAVICSKEAGLNRGLTLVKESIQDELENFTEFGLFATKSIEK